MKLTKTTSPLTFRQMLSLPSVKLIKNIFLLATFLWPVFCVAQQRKLLTDVEKLNKCITEQTSYFTFDGSKTPEGKGWGVLTGLFAQHQFVAWGEYHNAPLLSKLTVHALESAAKNGFKNWCVETSPFVAEELTRISRSKNPTDTLLKLFKFGYPKIGTFPFFSTSEDATMLMAANRLKVNIWGIDQEFQTCFTYALNKVYRAQSKHLQQRYKKVYDSLVVRWWYPETKLLDSLGKVISQREYKNVLNDIKISKEIYRNSDNELRATLMKNNFFNYYDHTPKNEKVFFKMGSNHLAKGVNLQTRVYDIGNAVYELSQRNHSGFANVYLMARFTVDEGKIIDDLESKDRENPKEFLALYDKEKWVLVDVRSLRLKMNADHSLNEDAYQLIEKYDYVLISPEVVK